jgi:hypothetical protein
MRYGLVLLMLCVSALPAVAWQWPVPVPVVERTFGSPVDGAILRGVELGGGAQPVFPVERGVIVYVHADNGTFSHPFGSFVVVEHEQAFRSIYAHLSAESLPPVGREVTPEIQIAVVGDSGFVRQRTLRLYLYDSRIGSYVNPMLLLPDLPDASPPRVEALFAGGEFGVYNLNEVSELPPGVYNLSATIVDAVGARGGRGQAAPYSIAVFEDGQQRFEVAADGLSVTDGRVELAPHGNDASVYGTDGSWNLGSVTVPSGSVTIEIVARDFAGNQTVRTVRLQGRAGDEDFQ